METNPENVTASIETNMITKKHRLELLSPAGSWEALQAAIQAGADAVYFGVDQLNMRARASRPFQISDLEKIVTLCESKKVQTYLALNTIIYDQDLSLLETICQAAKTSGVSAIIASDMAAIRTARNMDLEVHLSTQMNISNIEAVRFYAQFADVMVLARELNLQQITSIVEMIQREPILGPRGRPVRIELFIHGALCVAISGKCYMSLALTNHSANRGDCFQICRRTYRVTDTTTNQELDIDNQFVMSPKDLCTIGIIDKLIDSGTQIFKIEGRGRRAEYVYHTTRVYRQAIDAVIEGKYTPEKVEEWTDELKTVFNRGFWQNGYYLGESLDEWSKAYGSQATRQKTYIGKVLNYYPKNRVVHIDIQSDAIRQSDIIAIEGPTTGYIENTVTSLYAEDHPADTAFQGQKATLVFPQKVRRNDQVYVLRDRTDWQKP